MSGVTHKVGCVSFLNSKPLIEPLVAGGGRAGVDVRFAVPSALMGLIEAGEVSTGLLPVVDFQASSVDLVLVPAGMIGCDGPTLTVRIYSKVPPEQITVVHGDVDSHTSVVLARVILRERFGRAVEMVPFEKPGAGSQKPEVQTMLLIGDKVVNAAPDESVYRYQLDLGEQWKALTGLPFVFAMWMMRADRVDLGVARMLAEARRQGAGMTEELVERHAAATGWPRELARDYFTKYIQYEVTPRAREGLARFYELAGKLGVLPIRRPVRYLELQ